MPSKIQFSKFISLAALICILLGCGKKDVIDIFLAGGGSALSGCGDDLTADYQKPGSIVVAYYISQDMTDPVSGQLTCTTKGIKEKIKKVFDMYASIPETGYSFKYAGAADGSPTSCYANTHNDGAIHVFLNQDAVCGAITAHGEFEGSANWGPVGGSANATASPYLYYPGGHVVLPINSGTGINYRNIIHEVGHVLGLDHSPSIGSPMSYEGFAYTPPSVTAQEYLYLTEQDAQT